MNRKEVGGRSGPDVSRSRSFAVRNAFTMLALCGMLLWSGDTSAGSDVAGRFRTAQAPATPATAQPAARTAANSADHAIGGVATLQGGASVTRSSLTSALKLKDAIFKGDELQTAVNGTLGITFDDATTFSLRPNSRIAVDDFVYQEHGSHNVAAFNVIQGTITFVASAVAKTGDMKVDTPTASIGIRGTTGVIEVPAGGTAGGAGQSTIKLYPDADGRVGRIEVFGRDGTPLGVLTRGVTGFAVRAEPPGGFAAVALQISAQESDRDFAFVRQAYASQRIGRQINLQRQNLLRQNRPRLAPPSRPGQQQRLNLLPPSGRSIGPTLLQPQRDTLPATIPPDLPVPQLPPDRLPPIVPPTLPPLQPLPVPSTPPTPQLPRLPLPR
jgi:hypothetical protein